jgi:effector-binding domain-containing protein
MVVDFELRKVPSFRVASIARTGPWKKDNLRAEFGELTSWARAEDIPTGRWIFFHKGDVRWEACLEVKRRGQPKGRVHLKTLPATYVARCLFDPEVIADRVIYHGLTDWVRSRRRSKEIKSVGGSREVYSGDPWSDPQAWANCEVQFLVRK